MKNKMIDLRNHLFAALEGLADTDTPMEIDRAKAIADVAQTIINSAKVEVDAYKIAGRIEAPSFLTSEPQPLRAIEGSKKSG